MPQVHNTALLVQPLSGDQSAVPAPPTKKIRTADYDSGVVAPEPAKAGMKRRIAPTVVSSSTAPADRDLTVTPTKAVETLTIGQEGLAAAAVASPSKQPRQQPDDKSLKVLSSAHMNANAAVGAGGQRAKAGAVNILQAKPKKKRIQPKLVGEAKEQGQH